MSVQLGTGAASVIAEILKNTDASVTGLEVGKNGQPKSAHKLADYAQVQANREKTAFERARRQSNSTETQPSDAAAAATAAKMGGKGSSATGLPPNPADATRRLSGIQLDMQKAELRDTIHEKAELLLKAYKKVSLDEITSDPKLETVFKAIGLDVIQRLGQLEGGYQTVDDTVTEKTVSTLMCDVAWALARVAKADGVDTELVDEGVIATFGGKAWNDMALQMLTAVQERHHENKTEGTEFYNATNRFWTLEKRRYDSAPYKAENYAAVVEGFQSELLDLNKNPNGIKADAARYNIICCLATMADNASTAETREGYVHSAKVFFDDMVQNNPKLAYSLLTKDTDVVSIQAELAAVYAENQYKG